MFLLALKELTAVWISSWDMEEWLWSSGWIERTEDDSRGEPLQFPLAALCRGEDNSVVESVALPLPKLEVIRFQDVTAPKIIKCNELNLKKKLLPNNRF